MDTSSRALRTLLACGLVLLALGPGARAEAPIPTHGGQPGASAPASQPANRDRHGPSDIGTYIQRLESPERLAELQVELVIDKLDLAEDALVADIGCGPGVFALPFARRASRGVVYAADVEPRQLDALRGRMQRDGVENVVPVLASYHDPHLPPGRMDVIFIADTYHHLEHRVGYFRQLSTDLRPGGRLVLLEWKAGELPMGPPAGHKVTPEARAEELRAAGFQLRTRWDTHTYHDFEVWEVRRD